MPVLMPLIEGDVDVVRDAALPEDQRTLDVSLSEVISFDEVGIRVRGETMEQALLAAVDLYWQSVGNSARHSRVASGEIEAAVAIPRPEPDAVALVIADLEPDVSVGPGSEARVAAERGEQAEARVAAERGAQAEGLVAAESGELAGRQAVTGFSESEEAFFDGYELEESLGREELLAMFDPAMAWKERRVGQEKKGQSGRRGRQSAESKDRRTPRLRLLSFLG